jgi:uracil-DNA glycosylase family 4
MVEGHPTSPLLVIGMAPGREELEHNKPFVGGSGKVLWKQLFKKAGINRTDCYIVNTIGELPQGIDGNPTKEQLDRWWDVFDEAVSRSRARAALLLGKAALERFTGLTGGIESWRGYLVTPAEASQLTRTKYVETTYKNSNKKTGRKKGDPKIAKIKQTLAAPWPPSIEYAIPALHPAAILRTGFALLPALASDCARVGRALSGTLKLTSPIWQEGIPSEMLPPDETPTVVDIETDMFSGTITRIGANVGTLVWTSLWDADARDYLNACLQRPHHGPAVAFNIGFDAPRLADVGCPLPEPWWDAMLAAAMAEPDLKKSLNYVASLYLDKRRHKHLSADQPAFYNAMDVSDTHELYYILRGELERTGQLALFEKRMMPTMPTLVEMTRRGIKVDKPAHAAWVAALLEQHIEILGRWEDLVPGMRTAGNKLRDFCYGELGLPVQYHKYGKITTEVGAIQRMLLYEHLNDRQRQILTVLLELRSVEKELRTYAEVELGGDGCVHPGFLPAGKDDDSFGKGIAGTGRIIASRPNIQNQPQDARRMFIARDPSMVLLARDYSQIEARVIAQLSGDEVLQHAIEMGLHTANAAAMGIDKTRAKNAFFGWAYGVGKRTLHNTFVAKGFPIPEAECGLLLSGFDRRFNKAAAWRNRITSEVKSRYYLTNAFGRRRYFMGSSRDNTAEGAAGSKGIPAAFDFHPQSDAADIMWTILRQLDDALRGTGANLLATVHDEVLAEVPRGQLAQTDSIMCEVMEQTWPELEGLVVPTEAEIGENWGEMKPYATN